MRVALDVARVIGAALLIWMLEPFYHGPRWTV